ncbi:MAG TPA: PIN domain-containing protein [Bacillota bacterium]|nr:PIN domain-containing protein [Bacillota bacterium]HQC36323.1 PIN domain-containing protein [Bacillota bacterium]
MLKKIFRFVFTFCGMLFGYGLTNYVIYESKLSGMMVLENSSKVLLVAMFTGFFGLFFLYIFNVNLGRAEGAAKKAEHWLSNIPPVELASSLMGLLAGLLTASLISQVINGIKALETAYINVIITVFLYVGLGSGSMFLFRALGRRLKVCLPSPSLMLSRDGREKGKRSTSILPKILDTSVIIDGRIADVLKTGFIEGDIVIPEFVLVELRHIADSADSLKRNRGRRGLDILNRIQTEYGVEIYNTASDKAIAEIPEVDVKLLKLAQKMNGMVVTNDYNLNKVAAIQGIGVLNINELANRLKPTVLPGEEMQLFLVKEGKEPDQGVAYLDDGTMIVVEGGREHIGSTIDVFVTSVLQTSGGRMIFARPRL